MDAPVHAAARRTTGAGAAARTARQRAGAAGGGAVSGHAAQSNVMARKRNHSPARPSFSRVCIPIRCLAPSVALESPPA
jgi:hypothetical protein